MSEKKFEESIEMIDLLPASELLECILYQKNDSHVCKKINRALARLDEKKFELFSFHFPQD